MKYGSSILLVCIVAAAGVAIWLPGIDPMRSFRSPNGTVRRDLQPPAETSLPTKAKQASKLTQPRTPQTRAVTEPATSAEVPRLAPTVAGGQIPTATQKEAVVNTNGNPALSIRRLDHGHDLESLVYTRDRGREVTIISLQDGKVSSTSSPSGITPAIDATKLRSAENTAALLTGPAAPQPASIASAPPGPAPRPEVPPATKPPARPSAEANLGTCGEYRDGKLIVKPCSQVPLSPGEWLAKGSGASPGRKE